MKMVADNRRHTQQQANDKTTKRGQIRVSQIRIRDIKAFVQLNPWSGMSSGNNNLLLRKIHGFIY